MAVKPLSNAPLLSYNGQRHVFAVWTPFRIRPTARRLAERGVVFSAAEPGRSLKACLSTILFAENCEVTHAGHEIPWVSILQFWANPVFLNSADIIGLQKKQTTGILSKSVEGLMVPDSRPAFSAACWMLLFAQSTVTSIIT